MKLARLTQGLAGSFASLSGAALVAYVARFAQIYIVAYLIGPSELGLYALALSLLATMTVLQSFGLKQAYISLAPDGPAPVWLHTTWTMQVALGVGIAALIAVLAWPISAMVEQPRLADILLWMALAPLLHSLKSAAIADTERSQRFGGIALFEAGISILGACVTVAAAFWWRSTEGVIYAYVITYAASLVASYAVFPITPRLAFDRAVLGKLTAYGWNFLILSIATVVTTQFDNVAVGWGLGVTALGYYALAYRTATFPHVAIAGVLARIFLPKYRQLHSLGPAHVLHFWHSTFTRVGVGYLLLLAPLALACIYLTGLVLGTAWTALPELVAIICLATLIRGLTVSISPIMMVTGQIAVDTRYKMIETVLFLILLSAGIWLAGLHGAAWAGVGTYFLSLVLRLGWMGRTFSTSLTGPYVRTFAALAPLVCCVIAARYDSHLLAAIAALGCMAFVATQARGLIDTAREAAT